MVGIGVHREGQFQIHQLFLPDPVEEYRLLDEIQNLLEPYQVIVTFNGKSFDLPLLQTRFILNRMETRIGEKVHIDLLHLARRYLIPETYFNYLKLRDFSLLDGVFYHNRVDILSLAALFHFIGRVLSQPQESPLHSMDLASIARLYHDLGHWDTASELYAQSISDNMPQDFLVKTLLKNADLHKKQWNTSEAIELWKKAADYGNLEAHLELAKIYEHTLRQLDAALEWANRAFHVCNALPLPAWKRREWLHEINHRIERLEEKKRKENHGSKTV
jgi:tetratricopeptide (TPR) repeat protein